MPENDAASADQPAQRPGVAQTEGEILDYWTDGKLKDAQPLPLPSREPPTQAPQPEPPQRGGSPAMEDEEE